ncbi:MAG: 3-deoxy-manno-octulosonate cytidylyltransferase [Desulfovibrio sp.]|nr:3-deoxy-manno-octulosonate cytidylyltransferase [Desulfovibrio sp.]
MKIAAVIPARYASTRLPGKPLLDILGKPMIQRVYENACRAGGLDEIAVATDDERIFACVEGFGGRCLMTSPKCANGTERLHEAAGQLPADAYVNIQGDEPLLEPEAIDLLCACMREPGAPACATLARPCSFDEAASPNLVKVVLDARGQALYFSRARIPYPRDGGEAASYLAHIGVYAYRADTLERFAGAPASPLEDIEKLEQLRLLQMGIPICVLQTRAWGPGVDTQADLEEVRRILAGQPAAGKALPALEARKAKIAFVVTDADGVLTDGSLWYTAEGETLKAFTARDGIGFKMLEKAGIRTAVLSGRDSAPLRRRIQDLGIGPSLLGFGDKKAGLARLMADAGMTREQTLYIGDDAPDAEAFALCGLACTVADGHPLAKSRADWVLESPGGRGAIHEIADGLMAARALASQQKEQA